MTGLRVKRWKIWALVAIAAIVLQAPAVVQAASGPHATILFSLTNIARPDTVVARYIDG